MLNRIGPLSEIYESYNDCFAATDNGQLTPEALTQRGWTRATSSDGQTNSLSFYGRADRAPIITLSGDKNGGICIVMARFKDVSEVRKFLSAWGDKLPAFKDGQLSFFAEGHPIMFRQAGSQTEPRLNLIVGTVSGTKE